MPDRVLTTRDFVTAPLCGFGRYLSHCSYKVVSKEKNSHTRRNLAIDKSELSDLSENDKALDKTYESRIMEGESNSKERNEDKHRNFEMKDNFGSFFT
ncbi:UNVERIFIED_CONTAM: hypothetical protein NCL1_45220 [Trichonephila clavipes]